MCELTALLALQLVATRHLASKVALAPTLLVHMECTAPWVGEQIADNYPLFTFGLVCVFTAI